MLNLYLDKSNKDKCLDRIDYDFMHRYDPSWADNDMMNIILGTVDGSKLVLPPYSVVHPEWGGLDINRISGGCKALLCLYNMPGVMISSRRFGDNCASMIKLISDRKDVNIWYDYAFWFVDDQSAYFPEYDETANSFKEIIAIRAKHHSDIGLLNPMKSADYWPY